MGPNYRLTIDNSTGVASMIASRWPVSQIVGGQYSSTSVFRNITYTPLAADQFRPASQSVQTVGSSAPDATGTGPMFIELEPGNVNWWAGRNGFRLQVGYISGWPHCTLTADATEGTDTLQVDDVTGWTGVIGNIYEGMETEQTTIASVTANTNTSIFGTSVPTGPGTVTLTSPLLFNHERGAILTSLPYNIIWATVLYSAAQALTRGGVAMVLPSLPLSGNTMTSPQAEQTNTMMIGKSSDRFVREAQAILQPYKRIM